MSILFAGSPANAALVLTELVQNGVEIGLVLTRADAKVGRKGILTQTPVADVADKYGIEVVKANRITAEVLKKIANFHLDFAVVVAFGVLLDADAIAAMPKGWYNLHFSLLPAYRGAAPIQHALLDSRQETGITVFKIDEGLDTGPIAKQLEVKIEPGETFGDLLNRLSALGASMLLELIASIRSGFVKLTDQVGVPTSAPKIVRSDSRIFFSSTAKSIHDRFRATTPQPGAWAIWNGDACKLLELRLSERVAQSAPGTVHSVDSEIYVDCQDFQLQIISVQPAGRTAMNANDWYRGQPSVKGFDL